MDRTRCAIAIPECEMPRPGETVYRLVRDLDGARGVIKMVGGMERADTAVSDVAISGIFANRVTWGALNDACRETAASIVLDMTGDRAIAEAVARSAAPVFAKLNPGRDWSVPELPIRTAILLSLQSVSGAVQHIHTRDAYRANHRATKEQKRMASQYQVRREPDIALDPRTYHRGSKGCQGDQLSLEWSKYPELDDCIRYLIGMGAPHKLIARRLGAATTAVTVRISTLNRNRTLPTKGRLSDHQLEALTRRIEDIEWQRHQAGIPIFDAKQKDDILAAIFAREDREAEAAAMSTTATSHARPAMDCGGEPPGAGDHHAATNGSAVLCGALAELAAASREFTRHVVALSRSMDPDMAATVREAAANFRSTINTHAGVDRDALLAHLRSLPEEDLISLAELLAEKE